VHTFSRVVTTAIYCRPRCGARPSAENVRRRKPLISAGMLLQAAALGLMVAGDGAFSWALAAAVLLGLGTARVYPTLLGAVSDRVRPRERPAVGVYRF
jgi:MFS family permease